MSDNLFIFLTYNVISKDTDIEEYININDRNIYLVKTKDNDLYFVVGGKFELDADNDIRYDKSDSCLFVRNANTNKVKAINSHELKECLDYISIDEYCDELKELFFAYCDNKIKEYKDNYNLDGLVEKFISKYREVINSMCDLRIRKNENYISYADRIAANKETINTAKHICITKQYIEKIWLKALYNHKFRGQAESIIKRILMRVLRR